MACPAVQNFSTVSHNCQDFQKKFLNTKCVFWFSLWLLCETFLILRRIEGDIKNVYWSSCAVPLLPSDFSETSVFLTDSWKILKYQFHENPSSGSQVPRGRTDRQTDWQALKLIVAVLQMCLKLNWFAILTACEQTVQINDVHNSWDK